MTDDAQRINVLAKLAKAFGQAGAGAVLLALLVGLLRPVKPPEYVRLDLREWRCIDIRMEGNARVCDTWTRRRAAAGKIAP